MDKEQINSLFKNIDKKWKQLLIAEQIEELTKILDAIKTDIPSLCPSLGDIFNAFRLTSFDNCKVVIVGQDPYYTTELIGDSMFPQPVAHGLSFSSKGVKTPASLKNIYAALIKSSLIDNMPETNDLTNWAIQGILMLNRALTTTKGIAKSHTILWDTYVKNIIKKLCEIKQNEESQLTFVLWGKDAQNLTNVIGDYHKVLTWCHPSPLAQTTISDEQKFVSCDHFTILHEELEIEWDPYLDVKIFTDGAATLKRNPNIGGWAIYNNEGPYDGLVRYGKVPMEMLDGEELHPTNQRSEGLAIINALTLIVDEKILFPITIVTDSQFYIDVITKWMNQWHKIDKDFKSKNDGSPIKNRDIIMKIYMLYNTAISQTSIKLEHVESHKKMPYDESSREYSLWYGNYIADMYAKKGQECVSLQKNEVNLNDEE